MLSGVYASLLLAWFSAGYVAAADARAEVDRRLSMMSAGQVCAGMDEQWARCSAARECDACTPVDCRFSDWTSWSNGIGCTGLMFRRRSVEVENNKCGQPCSGNQTESKVVAADACASPVKKTDCEFAEWSEWTSNCSSALDQRYSTRVISKEPTGGGKPCVGETSRTSSCETSTTTAPPLEPEPCIFADWGEWQLCSSLVDGARVRARAVAKRARNGGDACEGATTELAPCDTGASTTDCLLGAWSEWSSCRLSNQPAQRTRSRDVVVPASESGKACIGPLSAIKGCGDFEPTNCVISQWSQWSTCMKSCGGGQQYRSRSVTAPATNGGDCNSSELTQINKCNIFPCEAEGNAIVSEWSDWTACSTSCGEGNIMRERALVSPATSGGAGFYGPMAEIARCEEVPCVNEKQDCVWKGWSTWSTCSKSCGAGIQRRSRYVEIAPKGGGKPCDPLVADELAPCSTQLCSAVVIDGTWSNWQDWSSCSASCEGGYRSRSRFPASAPNAAGAPVVGLVSEIELCTDMPPCIGDQDCELSTWGDWSFCSASCTGVHFRSRRAVQFSLGNGKPCFDTVLQESSPCGDSAAGECSTPSPIDCEIGEWTVWSQCSRSCDGGYMERRRSVKTFPTHGGKACEGVLHVMASCNADACGVTRCNDCKWSPWGMWSDCDKCGTTSSVSYRSRHIEQLPNACGKQCDLTISREVVNCTKPCPGTGFCSWTEWSSIIPCSKSCGSDSAMRSRSLSFGADVKGDSFLLEGSDSGSCMGVQLGTESCNIEPCNDCVAVDCDLSEWSVWSAPSCTGLCARHRKISSPNNECGKPCDGSLEETKVCETSCFVVQNCALSVWSQWSTCDAASRQEQRMRSVEHYAQNGGEVCTGILSEIRVCHVANTACKLSDWSPWSACQRECGGGWQTRSRQILEDSKASLPCQESLAELQLCNSQVCLQSQVDCVLNDWSPWSPCAKNMLRYRSRSIKQAAENGGTACQGNLSMTESCDFLIECNVTEWSAWDACDQTCGGGQQKRQRVISAYPRRGGKPCPNKLAETRGCGAEPCGAPCAVSSWSAWTACTATCDVGQTQRSRQITRLRSVGAAGCNESMSETKACNLRNCTVVDCKWSQWKSWGDCSRTCDGGHRFRNRKIAQVAIGGGKICEPGDQDQVEPCNVQECVSSPCIDGKWDSWSLWSPCSRSCGGGTSFRMREVAVTASDCGVPALGNQRDTKLCNVDVQCEADKDCKFSDWNHWTGCSSTCEGVTQRSRLIQEFGRGNGAFCIGSLSETRPCNSGVGADTSLARCPSSRPVDCAMNEWSPWSACSASCGGGQSSRNRTMLKEPRHGGKGCLENTLVVSKECGRAPCSAGPIPVDCTFGDWQSWSACSKCGGKKSRFRSILSFPQNGGRLCDPTDIHEISQCPSCGAAVYCTWADWGEWSACDAACGNGRKSRGRYLTQSNIPGTVSAFESLASSLQHSPSQRASSKELMVAFAAGCFAFAVAIVGVRVFSGLVQRRSRDVTGATFVRAERAAQESAALVVHAEA
eukprot:TRINITY_DN42941_c0_g1_i1.p1 TRINITY_DN42941_c0_g1~~TRINITY_DN42941_c0_g1_i1.p1  ORF type:complete len:1553 (+),score=204.95 TRINITY_DN42941_c0_g1_i1:74-4660(+)